MEYDERMIKNGQKWKGHGSFGKIASFEVTGVKFYASCSDDAWEFLNVCLGHTCALDVREQSNRRDKENER